MIKCLLLLIIIPTIGYNQDKYLSVKDYTHQRIVEKIKIENTSATKCLVYQPSCNGDNMTTVLVLEKTGKAYCWLIVNDSLIRQDTLSTVKIFTYKNFLMTGATKKEGNLKFVPPVLEGDATANVIYEDKYRKFYFEYGKNVISYTPSVSLEKYRKEWINIIHYELKDILHQK